MLGEFPEPGVQTPTLEQFLPRLTHDSLPRTQLEAEVLALLSQGRTRESAYDLKNSPVATFIIEAVGFDCVGELLTASKDFLNDRLSSEDFLNHRLLREGRLDVVEAITQGVQELSEHRSRLLKASQTVRV
jgi:hypothetical protein